ncbi:MAG: prepilin-type N-terminal cleavage/methylation domain-containing protein [Erysipelothrix sp.]|nr:prepilin-type N-terminal cleavage/methylation domain-containing protein [Erysipelothrix sp.]
MIKGLGSSMELQLSKRGFTLLEMLIVMFITSYIVLFALPKLHLVEYLYFNPTHAQLKAMATKTRVVVIDGLWFNENGNINQAQTVIVGKKKCIFQLGMGRYRCQKKASS